MTNYWTKRNKAALIEGRGFNVTVPAYPGWVFTVKRMCDWNADYQRAQVRIWQRPEVAAILDKLRKDPGYELADSERKADAATTREAFAEGCLAGWTGVADAKGKPMACDGPNRIAVLEHFPDIYAALVKAASNGDNFGGAETAKAGEAAAVAGN